MKRKYHGYAYERKMKIICKFSALLLIVAIVLISIDTKARPIINTVAITSAQNLASSIASDCVDSVLQSKKITYNELTNFVYGESGSIIAVNINIIEANRLEGEISSLISKKLRSTSENTISICIGSIIGGNFLNNFGPRIKIKMSLYGRCNSDVTSEFSAAGINQTRHKVYINIETKLNIIMNGRTTSTKVDNKIIIAETLLVGKVPLSYSS